MRLCDTGKSSRQRLDEAYGRYFDKKTVGLDFEGMKEDMKVRHGNHTVEQADSQRDENGNPTF